jgi:hypothetical protein
MHTRRRAGLTRYEFTAPELLEFVFQVAGAATAGFFQRSGEIFPTEEVSCATSAVVAEKTGIPIEEINGYRSAGENCG